MTKLRPDPSGWFLREFFYQLGFTSISAAPIGADVHCRTDAQDRASLR